MRAMTDAENAAPGGRRFGTGLSLFVLSLACPVFIPFVVASDLPPRWKAALSGLLALGAPELLLAAAAGVLGKAGFEALKHRFFALFTRLRPAAHVSRTRHRLGIVGLSAVLLFAFVQPYAGSLVSGLPRHQMLLAIAGDAVLLASLILLGGGFWDRLRALVAYPERQDVS